MVEGTQVMAQAIVAAGKRFPEKSVRSAYAVFARAVVVGPPVELRSPDSRGAECAECEEACDFLAKARTFLHGSPGEVGSQSHSSCRSCAEKVSHLFGSPVRYPSVNQYWRALDEP